MSNCATRRKAHPSPAFQSRRTPFAILQMVSRKRPIGIMFQPSADKPKRWRNYLTKGASILVRGKLTFNPWLSRDGEARVSADVVLQDFEFAGGSAAKTVLEARDEPIAAQENNQAASEEVAADDAEERAEMLAAMRDMDAGDEAFAGQY